MLRAPAAYSSARACPRELEAAIFAQAWPPNSQPPHLLVSTEHSFNLFPMPVTLVRALVHASLWSASLAAMVHAEAKPAFCHNLDCPAFTTLEKTDDFELRAYEPGARAVAPILQCLRLCSQAAWPPKNNSGAWTPPQRSLAAAGHALRAADFLVTVCFMSTRRRHRTRVALGPRPRSACNTCQSTVL